MASNEPQAVIVAVATVALLSGCPDKKVSPPADSDDAGAKSAASSSVPGGAGSAKDVTGDPLPAGAVARLGSERMIDSRLQHLQFMPGGKQLVSASYGHYVVWDRASGRRLFELEHDNAGPHVAVSPDGVTLATSIGDSSKIQLWNLPSRAPSRVVEHRGEVADLCYLAADHLVAASAGSIASVARDEGAINARGEFRDVRAMACAGGVIAVGDGTGSVYVVETGKSATTARRIGGADNKAVLDMAVSADGSRVAAAIDGGQVMVWPLAGGEAVAFPAHDGATVSVAFTGDGKELWSSGGDHWLRSWSSEDGRLISELPGQDGLTNQYLAVSDDGKTAATWSEHRGPKGSEAGRFWLWDLRSGELVSEPERHSDAITAIAYSPDGSQLATASEDGSVRTWQADNGRSISIWSGAQSVINAVLYSKDGERIYSAGGDAKLVAWEPASDQTAVVLPPIGGKVNALDLAPDGSRAVTGDETGRVWTWDLAARAKIQALDRQTYASITSAVFSPDGKYIAIAGSEKVVLIIGADSGAEVARLEPDGVISNYAIAFAPDGKLVATAGDDGVIRLWSTEGFAQVRSLEGHDGPIRALAFSSDSKRLVSGANDATARLWQVDKGEELAVFKGHGGAVTGVAFAPDGSHVATGSQDRTGLIWRVP